MRAEALLRGGATTSAAGSRSTRRAGWRVSVGDFPPRRSRGICELTWRRGQATGPAVADAGSASRQPSVRAAASVIVALDSASRRKIAHFG